MKIKFKNGSVVKKSSLPKKAEKSKVIRAISAMDKEKTQTKQQQSADMNAPKNGSGASDEFQDEFYTTGRIGRRNAMPDILGNNCTASSGADLPLKLSALTTNEPSSSQQTNVSETAKQANSK